MLWKPRNIPDQPSTNPKRTSTIWSETCVTCVPPRMVQMEFTKLTWSRSIHETLWWRMIHWYISWWTFAPCFFVANAPCSICCVSLPGYIFVIWSNFSFQISLLQTYQFLGDDNFAGCGTWLKPLSVRLTQISHLDHHMVWFCDIFVFQPQNKRSPKCSPSIKLVLWVAVQLTWYKDKLLLFTSSTSNIQSAKWPIRTLFVDLRDTLPCQPGQNQDERSENDLFSYFFAQATKRNEITKLVL